MKGSAITGPVAKEAAELWPVSSNFPISDSHCANRACSVLRPTPVL